MANKFQIKRTTVSDRTPNTTNASNTSFIDVGELAVNIPDKKLFTSNGSSIIELGSNLTNLSVTSNLTLTSIVANGSIGSNGNVLTSNGSTVYWAELSSGSANASYSYFLGNGGDLGSLDASSQDAFGVSTNFSFDFMEEGFVMPIDYGSVA